MFLESMPVSGEE